MSARQRPRETPHGLLEALRGLVRGRRLEPAVDAAMLAARVVAGSVRLPLHPLEQRLVGGEDAVGEEVARALPAVRVARDRAPRRAGELAPAREEVLVDRRRDPAVAVLLRRGANRPELLLVLVPRHRQRRIDLRVLIARRD